MVNKIFALQKEQPQFPGGTLEGVIHFLKHIVSDERRGGEFYIVGNPRISLKVGDRVIFQWQGLLIADALVVTPPIPTVDPARSESSFMRVTDMNILKTPIPISNLQERHIQIHGKRISTRGGSILTDDEFTNIQDSETK